MSYQQDLGPPPPPPPPPGLDDGANGGAESRPADDSYRRSSRRDRSYSRSRSPSPRRSSRRDYDRDSDRGRDRDYDRDRGDRDRPSYRPARPAHPSGNPVDPSPVLGVFGLSIMTRERDLEDEFGRYGRVEKVVIVYDQRSDRSRGFGFVTMSSTEEAAKAIEGLNGLELHQRRMRVDYSTTRKAHAPTPGQYMGLPTRGDDRYASYSGGGGRGGDRYGDRYAQDSRDRYDRRRSPPRRRYDDYDDRDRDYDRSSRRRRSPSYGERRSRSRSPPRRSGAVDDGPPPPPPAPVSPPA